MTVRIPNPLDGFVVDRATIGTVGTELQRPECILAERDGTLWVADARGGVTRIAADGRQDFIGQRVDSHFANTAGDHSEGFERKFTQVRCPTDSPLPPTATS